MKKLLLLAILISSAFFAQAQKQDKSPTKRAQSKVDKLGETLNLNDTQKEQIYALFLEQSENGKRGGKKMSEFTKEERQAFIAERKAQKAAFDTKIGEILTPEQYATFKEKNKGYGKGQREGRRNHGQGRVSSEEKLQKRVDSYTERLQLTPTQQAQVSALLQAQQANRPEKGSKKDLSEAERAEMKAAKKAAKAEFDANMKNILSTEQYATFQNERMERKESGPKRNGIKKRGGLKSQEEKVQQKVTKLTEELNLTPTQQTQIGTLITEQQANRPDYKTAKDKSPAAKEARKAAKAAFDEKMKGILSAEQYETFQSLESGNRRKGNARQKLKNRNRKKQ